MAQSQTATYQGFAEIIKLLAGEAASACTKIVGLENTCTTAAAGSTFANPADDATHIPDNGLALQAADTVASETTSQTDDTLQVDHVFTATGDQSVTGFHICNNDGDVSFMECCFNAAVNLETGDTLTVQAKMQLEVGS